jgi:cytochrome oxidase Cu insertion factor (SCO1/SenC/PrrC family)
LRRTALFSAAILLLPLLAACSRSEPNRPADVDELSVGHAAPAFTLPSAAGGSVSLSDFKGKPVLLYFSMGPG